MSPVPFIDLGAQHASLRSEIESAVRDVLDSRQFILGPRGAELEKAIAAALGAKHGIGCASGSDALYLVFAALGIGPGDKVITAPFTFFASAGSISRTGAKPVFADIDPQTLQIDPASVRKAVTRNTKAILPVHLFGLCADMDAIARAAGNIPIVEDAAQAYGAGIRGRKAGAMGLAGCLSFYPTKNLGAAGDAGMVVTSDAALAEEIRLLRVHGSKGRYRHDEIGINSRLDEIQAAILLVKLKYIDRWNEARIRIARRYDEELKGLPVRTPFAPAGYRHTYHLYTIRTEKRDALAAFLGGRGIGTGVYYPIPMHLQPCYASLGHKPGDFPNAEKASAEVLSLPMYPEMAEEACSNVIQAVREFFAE